jgi:hypothetical protein
LSVLASSLKSPELAGGMFPPNITFASQNCNSLNVSTSCEKQIKKISSILSLYTTFIFLSDIRLGNTVTQEDIEKTFMCNKIKNYSLFHNSSRNKRGVGILIDKSIELSTPTGTQMKTF